MSSCNITSRVFQNIIKCGMTNISDIILKRLLLPSYNIVEKEESQKYYIIVTKYKRLNWLKSIFSLKEVYDYIDIVVGSDSGTFIECRFESYEEADKSAYWLFDLYKKQLEKEGIEVN